MESERQRDAEGRFLESHGEDTRAAVHADYRADLLTLDEISDKHGVAKSRIHDWARDECWVRRRPRRVDPNNLFDRMLALLDQQIEGLEEAMKKGTPEIAMLAKVVVTLDKVLLLKGRVIEDRPQSSKRAQELRAKIAARIGELNGD